MEMTSDVGEFKVREYNHSHDFQKIRSGDIIIYPRQICSKTDLEPTSLEGNYMDQGIFQGVYSFLQLKFAIITGKYGNGVDYSRLTDCGEVERRTLPLDKGLA
jgi:hypothetical protein